MAGVTNAYLVVLCYGFASCITVDISIEYLAERIKALETQGSAKGKLLQKQSFEIEHLRSVIGDYKSRLQIQEQLTEKYMKRVNELERGASDYHGDNVQYEVHVQDADMYEKNVSGSIGEELVSSLRPRNSIVSGTAKERIRRALPPWVIAFHAVFKGSGTSHLGAGSTIVYPDVVLNIGTGYKYNGIFVSRHTGIYIFSVSIAARHDTGANVGVMKNGQMIAGAFGDTGGNFEQGSVTVVTELAVNDQVWVKLTSSSISSMYGYSFTSFMGCLVYPL